MMQRTKETRNEKKIQDFAIARRQARMCMYQDGIRPADKTEGCIMTKRQLDAQRSLAMLEANDW